MFILDELLSTSRNITRKIAVKPFHGENVLISFENKELFNAAQRASMPYLLQEAKNKE